MEEGMAEELSKKKMLNHNLRRASQLYALGVLLDFYIAYAVKIDDEKKCMVVSAGLGYIVFSCRTLLEVFTTLRFCQMFDFKEFMSKLFRKDTTKYVLKLLWYVPVTRYEFPDFLMLQQLLGILLVAIIGQVIVLIALAKTNQNWMLFAIYYLLAIHLLRIFTVIRMLSKRPKTSSSRFRTKIFRVFVFVFLYSIQLFAAVWYLPAMYRETGCWKAGYQNFTRQIYNHSIFRCRMMNQSEFDFVNDYCSKDAKNYNFGIYEGIHNSGVQRNSTQLQILYFSRWSLQYLSSFAQGLEAGDNVWQNIFIIFLIFYAIVIFFFLIGEVQSEKDKFAELKPKLRQKDRWMRIKKISRPLQSLIRKNEREKWPAIEDVNIENMFNKLPVNLRGQLTGELLLEQLKKVEVFGKWGETALKDYLCGYLKPVFYAKGTRVIQEGDPIVEIIFVVQGVLWTYSSRVETTSVGITSSRNNENDYMRSGDIHGKELVNSIQADPNFFNFPISTKTIQAVTNVEAFVLLAYDLKTIMCCVRDIQQQQQLS